MKKLGSLLLASSIFLFSGCSHKVTICPSYPKPSQQVLNLIKSLGNEDVDKWMTEQYKLNKKLGVCNEL